MGLVNLAGSHSSAIAQAPSAGGLRFENVAAAAGLAGFKHSGGGSAEKWYIPEVMSGGVCAADFDGDNWTDIVLVNGGSFESVAGKTPPPPHGTFRNTGGRFEDVTTKTGIRNAGWGMGCTVADYDADGDPDILITNFLSPNQLWRNDGSWKFTDVTKEVGVGGDPRRWNTGATFGDFDADGLLDLFVAGYVRLDPANLPDPEKTPDCRHRGLVINCGPRGLKGDSDLLFRNIGKGRFQQVHQQIVDPRAFYGLGTVFLPLGPNGAMELYVANDSTPNALYGFAKGTPRDHAIESGVALSEEGHEQAGMGIAWGDYDRDGRIDLYVTNFVDDYNTLYKGLDAGLFQDVTRRMQLSQPTWVQMGWGTAFADFDRDGDDDLIVTNGHVYPQVDRLELPSRWRMPMQAFMNKEGRSFAEVPRDALPGVAVGRGLAVADFWNDGRIGAIVNNLDGTPALYRPVESPGNYIELRLEGRVVRDATGATVTLHWDGGRALRIVASGGSYLSSNDHRVHAGVGTATEVRVEIRWPGGEVQKVGPLKTNNRYSVAQGGAPVALR